MEQRWPPQIGDEVRVTRSHRRGPVVSIDGSGAPTVYAVSTRIPIGVDRDTLRPPGRYLLSEIEPIA